MAAGKYTGIVLAGGKSSRMGKDKGWIIWKGTTLVGHAVNTLKGLCTDILISTHDPRYEKLGYPVIADHYQDSGPMAGIHACLSRSRTAMNLVIPVDTPLVNKELYQHLLQYKQVADVIVPLDHENFFQPLCAVYNKSITRAMEEQIHTRVLGFTPLFEKVNCIPVKIDPSLSFFSSLMFLNINSPSELGNLQADP
jgi:molybdopterin-guanine dinucleotide biosynthesis protein A